MSELRIRPAARAIVIDPDDRILLVRFEFPGRTLWATPGGGIEPGRDSRAGASPRARRGGGSDRSRDRARRLDAAPHHPLHRRPVGRAARAVPPRPHGRHSRLQPRHSWEQLNAEHVFELRWWTPGELGESEEGFAPTRLAELVQMLLRDGPPAEPIDVGV